MDPKVAQSCCICSLSLSTTATEYRFASERLSSYHSRSCLRTNISVDALLTGIDMADDHETDMNLFLSHFEVFVFVIG
jgi:hypothetical protein